MLRSHAISHRAVAALPLRPHPQQRWVAGVNEVDNPHVGLADVLPMETPAYRVAACFFHETGIASNFKVSSGGSAQRFTNQFAGG